MIKKIISLWCLFLIIIPVPVGASSVSLSLSPSSNSVTTGNNFNVNVNINTSVNVNSVDVYITFNPAVVEILSITPNTSAFDFPMPNSTFILDNSSGLLNFVTGKSVPGTASGSIATLTFKGKVSGSSALSFKSNTIVLNVGVTVASLFSNSAVTVSNSVSPPSSGNNSPSASVSAPAAPRNEKPYAPTVSSLTHSDESKWYNERTVKVNWSKAGNVSGFSYVLDKNAGTVPDDSSEGLGTSKEFSEIEDGISYFHIKAKNEHGWGSVKHFKINIDTKKPENLVIQFEVGGTPIEPIIAVKFEAQDTVSGINHYEIKIDEGEYSIQTSPFILSAINKSNYIVWVKAVDNAGNFIEEKRKYSSQEVVIPVPIVSEVNSIFKITSNGTMLKEYLVKGKGSPKTKVLIFVDGVNKAEAEVLESGEWLVTVKELKTGKHTIFAKTMFGEKMSKESNKIEFIIGDDGSLVMGSKKNNKSWYYVLFFFLLGLIYPAYLFIIRRRFFKHLTRLS